MTYLGSVELLLEASQRECIIAKGHVHSPQVAVRPALARQLAHVLQDRQLLQYHQLYFPIKEDYHFRQTIF